MGKYLPQAATQRVAFCAYLSRGETLYCRYLIVATLLRCTPRNLAKRENCAIAGQVFLEK